MKTLPARVYHKHNAYYYVTPEKQWIRLGTTEDVAIVEYSRIASAPEVLSTMNRVFDKYVQEALPQKAARTQKDNLKELKNLRAVFGAMRPQDVKPRHIAQYLAVRTAKVRGNREVALLQHVFKKALNWGVVEINPCRGIERNPEYPRDRYVTDQELVQFLSCAPERLVCYVELKLLTGLRQADLLKLRFEDFSSTGLSLTISKSGRGSERRGQLRVLFPMVLELESLVKRLKTLDSSSTGWLFPTQRRRGTYRPLRTSGFDSLWDRTWLKARRLHPTLSHFREHDLRAKAATDADHAGLDATSLLVHGSKKTTQAYLRGRRVVVVRPFVKNSDTPSGT
jgi:integrase